MPSWIRRISAGAAIILGSAHLVYGMVVFKALTPDHLWFAGAGIAMICVGLAHWNRPARVQAALMCIYLGVLALILPLPQIFIGLAIFLTLLVSNRRASYA